MACCLVVLIGLISPRLALFLMAIFTNDLSRAFDSWLVPLLGFFLLPWTTLIYTLLWTTSHHVDGIEWVLVGAAVLLDLASLFGGRTLQRPPPRMNLSASTYVLALRETFRIARDATDEETVVGVELTHDGITAYGEGAPVDYWGETPEDMREAIAADGGELLGDDLFAGQAIAERLRGWDGPQGAKMALDGARHDWLGKRAGQPLQRLLGTARLTPPTSYTIGIDRSRARPIAPAGPPASTS